MAAPATPYRMSIDVGWRNMCVTIARIRTKEEILQALGNKVVPEDCFPPLGWACKEPEGEDHNKWCLLDLGGNDTGSYIDGACRELSVFRAVELGLIKRVRIEMQNVRKNPTAWGIEQGLKGFFGRIKATSPYGWPLEVVIVSPVKKFGYFGLTCPEGDEAKPDRKQLSVDITVSMVERQATLGMIPQKYARIISCAKKKDDFADGYLQDYAEEAMLVWGKAPFEACCRIIRVVKTKTYYARGRIKVNALFEKAVLRYQKKIEEQQNPKPKPKRQRKKPAPAKDDGLKQTLLPMPVRALLAATAGCGDEDDIIPSKAIATTVPAITLLDGFNKAEDEEEEVAGAGGKRKRNPKISMKQVMKVTKEVKQRTKAANKEKRQKLIIPVGTKRTTTVIDITEEEEGGRHNGGPLADEEQANADFIDPALLPPGMLKSAGYMPVSQVPTSDWQVE